MIYNIQYYVLQWRRSKRDGVTIYYILYNLIIIIYNSNDVFKILNLLNYNNIKLLNSLASRTLHVHFLFYQFVIHHPLLLYKLINLWSLAIHVKYHVDLHYAILYIHIVTVIVNLFNYRYRYFLQWMYDV